VSPWVTVGPLALPAYYLWITLGFCAATLALRREFRRSAVPVTVLYDLALPILPVGWLGARLFLLLEDPTTFLTRPWLLLHPGAGWVFHGGFLSVIGVLWLQCRRRGLSLAEVGDAFAPVLPLGVAIGRLGCLFAGCCHGRPADWPLGFAVPWSVTYLIEGVVPPSLLGVALHPAPLYDVALGLGLHAWLSRLHGQRAADGSRPPHGTVGASLLWGYGLGRFLTEFARGDLERTFHAGFSVAQWVGLAMAAVGGAWRWRLSTSPGAR
jgi:phosphatidylglycerol:prolipoprotein diacylglycerol transferase